MTPQDRMPSLHPASVCPVTEWRTAWVALGREVQRLHRDQRGAEEQVNKLLIFALISLPLLALLLFFGQTIWQKAKDVFAVVFGDESKQIPID